MYSNEWTDWHLTPNGWVRGSKREDFTGVETVDEPRERVKTVRRDERGARGVLSARWECEDAGRIAELEARFGESPDGQ